MPANRKYFPSSPPYDPDFRDFLRQAPLDDLNLRQRLLRCRFLNTPSRTVDLPIGIFQFRKPRRVWPRRGSCHLLVLIASLLTFVAEI